MKTLSIILLMMLAACANFATVDPVSGGSDGGIAIENMSPLWFETNRTDTSVTRYGYIFGDIHNTSNTEFRIDSIVYHQFYVWSKYNDDIPDLVVHGETGLIGARGTEWPPRYYEIVVKKNIVPPKNSTEDIKYVQMLVSIPEFSINRRTQTVFWRARLYATATVNGRSAKYDLTGLHYVTQSGQN